MSNKLALAVLVFAVGCGNMGSGSGAGGSAGGGGGGSGGGSAGGGSGGTGGGGSGGSGGEPDYVSGSRIKARTISTTDGARAFAGFYDSTLATACSFGRAADDAVRCLPTSTAYAGTYFSDSGCAVPLAYSAGCADAYAVRAETTNSCVDVGYGAVGTRTHVYPVGAAYAGTVWAGTPAACNMTPAPASFTLYSLGSEISADTFATGSVDIAP
jgi:hypothetical protein